MLTPIRLIVGIGNPGSKYALTRHNAGQRWVESLAELNLINLAASTRHQGYLGRGEIHGRDVRLLVPTTYVNNSGNSVGSVCRYFDLEPEEVLVAYDEVAFPAGVSRLKFGGGANGHNGVKSVIQHFSGSRDFGRLRIGVGHPGNASAVVGFLTRVDMPKADRELSEISSSLDEQCLSWLLEGDWQKAMTKFHSKPSLVPDEESKERPNETKPATD